MSRVNLIVPSVRLPTARARSGVTSTTSIHKLSLAMNSLSRCSRYSVAAARSSATQARARTNASRTGVLATQGTNAYDQLRRMLVGVFPELRQLQWGMELGQGLSMLCPTPLHQPEQAIVTTTHSRWTLTWVLAAEDHQPRARPHDWLSQRVHCHAAFGMHRVWCPKQHARHFPRSQLRLSGILSAVLQGIRQGMQQLSRQSCYCLRSSCTLTQGHVDGAVKSSVT